MKTRGWAVELFVEDFRKVDFDVIAAADLVGISTITSTAPRAYAIADRARAMGKTVIMGGPHVTYLTDEALEHADFVVRGEGEAALAAFVEAWEQRRRLRRRPQPLLPGRGRDDRPQSPGPAGLGPRPHPLPRLLAPAARGQGAQAHVVDPRPDLAGLPLRLLVLLGDRHVRPQVPLPLDGEHHRGAAPLRRGRSPSSSSTTTTSPPTRSAPASSARP
ncbi:MAG: cobalamin-dependent protein [Candidatus Moduliflexus flocculans]|nr:cobalamin-dependent protein [Candidatus Moduliflexus flocculans]